MLMDGLFGQVKRKLNITWDDWETNARVADVITSATSHLRYMLGITDEDFDFSIGGIENTLFLAYCFYEWNHAVDEFNRNYLPLIMSARAKYEVVQNKESGGDADGA